MTSMPTLDLKAFWADNDKALADPWSKSNPHVPMRHGLGYHTMFAELGLPYEMNRLDVDCDYEFARRGAKAYNQKAKEIIGVEVCNEEQYNPARRFPRIRGVGELFECQRVWQSESWWLLEAAHTPAELSALLDRTDRLDIRAAMFPDDWEPRCAQLLEQWGARPGLGKSIRGPVTLATSIYGSENLIYLILDEPQLAARFRDTIQRVALEYYAICDEVSDPAQRQPCFRLNDDNCALLTPEMYEFFALPIVTALFERFAPAPGDVRYQHSDSDMAHIMPLLRRAGLNACNFGPNLRVAQIRAALPNAVIHGQLAPFTLMNNDADAITAEAQRDCGEAGIGGGLVLCSAGSVNDGTRLTSIRAVMHAVQQHAEWQGPPVVPTRCPAV